MIPAAYWFFLLIGLILIGAGVLLIDNTLSNRGVSTFADIAGLLCVLAGIASVLVQIVVWLFAYFDGRAD